MAQKNQTLRCPTCRTLVTATDENFPFCSDRCRLIDLGKWSSGAYRISSPILDPDVLEGLENQPRRRDDDDEDVFRTH
ncbi:DNA gyrase inhibitor YacG [Silvibacterium sp.]|uniref:DNA gyrase inhibitor YacG n=1 Tax=Silvibacterium sp. TaxID=1964179 RepID=UPI0039E3A92B